MGNPIRPLSGFGAAHSRNAASAAMPVTNLSRYRSGMVRGTGDDIQRNAVTSNVAPASRRQRQCRPAYA